MDSLNGDSFYDFWNNAGRVSDIPVQSDHPLYLPAPDAAFEGKNDLPQWVKIKEVELCDPTETVKILVLEEPTP